MRAGALGHFVELFGFSAREALTAATKTGGELMDMKVGWIREGYLADRLPVDGDPTDDVRILQDKPRLRAIMKDGVFDKAPADAWRAAA